MSPGWLYVVFPNWFLFNSPQFDLWMKLGEPATRISLMFKRKQKRSTSFAENNVLPFGPSGFLLPRLKWAAKFSSEVEVVEHAEHKRGITQIEISRSPDVRLHRVAETPPFLPDRHQPCLQTPPPSSSHPAKIGPNSTTGELNSLKFKWEMSFHWNCKYWKWAGARIGWMCVHLNVVKRDLPAVSFDQSKTFLLHR